MLTLRSTVQADYQLCAQCTALLQAASQAWAVVHTLVKVGCCLQLLVPDLQEKVTVSSSSNNAAEDSAEAQKLEAARIELVKQLDAQLGRLHEVGARKRAQLARLQAMGGANTDNTVEDECP